MRDVTKKGNAVIRHIKTADVTQTNKFAMAAALWLAKEVELKKSKRGLNVNRTEKVKISQEMVKMQCIRIPNSKAPGINDVQGYWFKKLTSLHPRIAVQLNHILDGERPLPDWMNSALPKRPGKGEHS